MWYKGVVVEGTERLVVKWHQAQEAKTGAHHVKAAAQATSRSKGEGEGGGAGNSLTAGMREYSARVCKGEIVEWQGFRLADARKLELFGCAGGAVKSIVLSIFHCSTYMIVCVFFSLPINSDIL